MLVLQAGAGGMVTECENLLGGMGKRLVKLLVGAPAAVAPALGPLLQLCQGHLERMASPVHAELPDGARLFGMTALRFLVEVRVCGGQGLVLNPNSQANLLPMDAVSSVLIACVCVSVGGAPNPRVFDRRVRSPEHLS